MTYHSVYDIKNNQLIIDLPETFKHKKKVLVTVNDVINSRDAKLLLMQQAVNDPLFIADANEVNEDFSSIDNEN